MWLLFICAGYFMIDITSILQWDILEITQLFFYLSIIFFTIIYVFYDILYLEIPESILLIANIWVLSVIICEMLFPPSTSFFPWMISTNESTLLFVQIIISILTLWWLYAIMTRGMNEIYDVIVLISLWCIILASNYFIFSRSMTTLFESPLMSAILWAMSLFTFFFIQIIISRGNWMGWGDLRIAILWGFITGIYFTLPAGFITYISGSIIGIILLFLAKWKKWKENPFQHQIPFGPFIAMWYLWVMFFSPQISYIIALYF
jgi:hypothetical protein